MTMTEPPSYPQRKPELLPGACEAPRLAPDPGPQALPPTLSQTPPPLSPGSIFPRLPLGGRLGSHSGLR